RRFVIGDLQNSFVHGEDNDLAEPIGFIGDMQGSTRFERGGDVLAARVAGEIRRGARRGRRVHIDLERKPALFFVRGKRHDAVTQRADENFFRIKGADERDVDVTTAFEIFRNTNVLDAASRVRPKPLLRVNAVALYRN